MRRSLICLTGLACLALACTKKPQPTQQPTASAAVETAPRAKPASGVAKAPAKASALPPLDQLLARAKQIGSADAPNTTMVQAVETLDGPLKRAVLALVVAVVDRDKGAFTRLVAPGGLMLIRGAKRTPIAPKALATQLAGPEFLGLLEAGTDPKAFEWQITPDKDGTIKVNANGVYALAKLKRHGDDWRVVSVTRVEPED